MQKFYKSPHKFLLSITVFLAAQFLAINANAQKIKSFSADPAAYSADLEKFLKDITTSKEKEAVEALYLDFSTELNGGTFSDEEFNALVETSNNLLRKRVVELASWEHLLRTLVLIHQNEDPKYAQPWIEDLANMTKRGRSKEIREYLQDVYLGLSAQEFYNDGNLRWMAAEAVWAFQFEEEAKFSISDADIWGFFKTDSTIVEGTQGVFYPRKQKFFGEGGNVYWSRAGISEDSLFAELNTYTLNTSKTELQADSVMLHSKMYVHEPIMGAIEERLSSRSTAEHATFPRFVSYNQRIELKQVYPNVDLLAGISVIGAKFYASGTPQERAQLLFNYEGKNVVKAQSERVLLRQDLLTSDETQITIHIDEDSIYHPKSSLKFIPGENQLTLNRDKQGLSATPYTDTYHNMDIYFEVMSWKLNEPQFHLGNLNLGAESPVIFESENYYRSERMQQIKGLDDEGPLRKIEKVTKVYGRKEMNLDEMANGLRMTKEATHRFMLQMSVAGFVNYNTASETIVVKEKLFQYNQNERGRRDFDVIRFVSNLSSGANASVSLLNHDMEIRGISAIALSDSQEVALFPLGRKITVHEGLDFDFDGRIRAGRFDFWGQKFFFDYELFQMNMATIDSMRFMVPSFTPNANGDYPLVRVKNVLQNINGELKIDKSNNKSGRISYTEYPIFKSGKESNVFYDRPSIFGGVYDRDKFYVTLEPFEIDSLDNTTTQGLFFAGTLNSGGIFPDIDENIRVQEDYSLGFKTSTPAGGFPGYGGKGTYTGDISLSNKGFEGMGKIDYLTSTAHSNDLVFFLDSTNGTGDQYEIKEQKGGVQYPHVLAAGVKMNWRPYDDVFYTKSQATPFDMYDDIGMKAKGTLALSPTKLGGSGRIDYLDAQNDSEDFLFENREFSSEQMAFRVRADSAQPWGFELKNARGFVNFDREKGEFTVNDSASYLNFPINQYIAFMDFAEWFIPEKSLEVQKRGGGAQSHMVSTRPSQDSLQFMAGKAKFSLIPSLLEGFEVPKIEVADANILPDTGYVAIEKEAFMRTLNNAKILANRTTKFHNFYEATVDVKTRHKYNATGYYDYVDKDLTAWPLKFHSISPDTSATTIGEAKITQEDAFYLSPFFGYYGDVVLTADVKNMTFDGYTLIQHSCPNIQTTWFKFTSVIEPTDIVIDLPKDNPSTRADNLYNGIYIAPDSTSGYSAFLSRESAMADRAIIQATGVLFYDEALNSYIVTTPERLKDDKAPGNYLALNNKDCITTGKGKISFGEDAGRVEIASYGLVTHNLRNDEIALDMSMTVNFLFNEDILKTMTQDFQGATDLPGTDLSVEPYKIGLNYLLSEKERQKYDEEIELYGASEKVPRPLRQTFVFTELKLVFNPQTNSFVSEGPINIGNSMDENINKQVEGIIEVASKRRGDELYMYFESGGGEYYYWQYKRNVMQFYHPDKEILRMVLETDVDKRSLEAKDKTPRYIYNAASRGKVMLFLQRFED